MKQKIIAKGMYQVSLLKTCGLYVKNPFNEIRMVPIKSNSTDFTALGSSEIRVITEDGKQKFAAPSMILHYVIDHNYCPPEEFMSAVINGPKPGSNEYEAYEKRYNIDCLWGEPDDIVVISEKLRNGVLNNDRKLIYDHSAFYNIITKDGSLLNVAIKSRNVELVTELILLGADLNKFSGIELNNVTANPYWPEYDSVRCPRFARNRVLSEEIRGKVSTDDFPSACR